MHNESVMCGICQLRREGQEQEQEEGHAIGTCNRDARVSTLVHEGRGVDSGEMRAADISDVLMALVAVLSLVCKRSEMQWRGRKGIFSFFFCLLSKRAFFPCLFSVDTQPLSSPFGCNAHLSRST
jgi:hypothetical protein